MKPRTALGSICCLALLVPAAGQAARQPIPTTIARDTAAVLGPNLFSLGHVGSRNPRCVAGRTVKLVYFYGEDRRLVDTDRTSANGVWGGVGSVAGLTGLRFTVTRKTFGPRRDRRTCAPASGQITD